LIWLISLWPATGLENPQDSEQLKSQADRPDGLFGSFPEIVLGIGLYIFVLIKMSKGIITSFESWTAMSG